MGDANQFDWSHEIVILNGVTVTVKVAHVWPFHSHMMFVRAIDEVTATAIKRQHEPPRIVGDLLSTEIAK